MNKNLKIREITFFKMFFQIFIFLIQILPQDVQHYVLRAWKSLDVACMTFDAVGVFGLTFNFLSKICLSIL